MLAKVVTFLFEAGVENRMTSFTVTLPVKTSDMQSLHATYVIVYVVEQELSSSNALERNRAQQ